jgi:D-beta-D-heptose 7-phosphate kinase/D-beta-D-heptose 1-phosphate adenosyltransferase
MERKIIAVSGGFDPVHKGHVQMIEEASKLGSVMVIINSDDWLTRKKGYVFMPWEDRAYIMGNIKGVRIVAAVNDSDNTVCEALRRMKPDAFANGGDRKDNNTPEMDVCNELGIELLWNIGGEKVESSSNLVNKARWEKRDLPSGAK